MISDEKRREVAKWLRYTAAESLGGESLQRALARIAGAKDTSWRGVLRRLADLIDRPTCHIVLKPSDSDFNDEPHYLCSRCGKAGIDVYERDDYTLAGIVDHAHYCSYCGARVVSDT